MALGAVNVGLHEPRKSDSCCRCVVRQVRFEVCAQSLDSKIMTIAPWRDAEFLEKFKVREARVRVGREAVLVLCGSATLTCCRATRNPDVDPLFRKNDHFT